MIIMQKKEEQEGKSKKSKNILEVKEKILKKKTLEKMELIREDSKNKKQNKNYFNKNHFQKVKFGKIKNKVQMKKMNKLNIKIILKMKMNKKYLCKKAERNMTNSNY